MRVDSDPGPFGHRLNICKTKVRNNMFRKDEMCENKVGDEMMTECFKGKHVSQPPSVPRDRCRRTSCTVPLLMHYVSDPERISYVEISMF